MLYVHKQMGICLLLLLPPALQCWLLLVSPLLPTPWYMVMAGDSRAKQLIADNA